MPTSAHTKNYTLEEGEKVTAVMAYTQFLLAWGDVITKEAIRVSTWMRTPMVPQYISLHSAQALMTAGSGPGKPQAFSTLLIPSSQIIAFHMLPPAQDPPDYEPDEPFRKMEPATALVGDFRFDGLIRMSTQTNLERYLDVAKEVFTAMYEVEITQPAMPNRGIIRVPYVLIRRDVVLFSPRV